MGTFMPQTFGVVGVKQINANNVIAKLENKIESIIKEMSLLQHEKDEETLIRLSELTQKRDRLFLQLEEAHSSFKGAYGRKRKEDRISVGHTVTLRKDEREMEVSLVSDYEVNTSAGAISATSPLGSQLLNKKNGDVVEVVTPIGVVAYEVIGFK